MEMACNSYLCCVLLFILLICNTVNGSNNLSYDIFDSHEATGRSLLQAKKSCDVDFQNKNYSVLTSQCKGPHYPAKVCCEALKEFSCPVADKVNDMSTDCSQVMFSYINIYGKYPPGLFANTCQEGKEGLDCSSVKSTDQPTTSSGPKMAVSRSALPVTLGALAMFLFKLH